MDALLAFAVAAVISFYGSLQLGLVNVAVIETTLVKGAKHAVLLAIGGVLPEIPYTLLAIFGTQYMGKLEENKIVIGLAIGVVLIGLGVFYILRKPQNKTIHSSELRGKKRNAFLKGFGLASLNPQLVFFWSGILVLLESGALNFTDKEKMINFEAASSVSPKWAFAFGAAAGALGILLVYIVLARKFRSRIGESIQRKLNVLVGLFFIVLGLYTALRNVL